MLAKDNIDKNVKSTNMMTALIRWETCGRDIARILSEFEDSIVDNGTGSGDKTKTAIKHHEDNPTFRSNFMRDVLNLYNNIFCSLSELIHLTMINNTCLLMIEFRK